MEVCDSCGEAAVETDDHNGEVQRVCTSCGLVRERCGIFSTEQDGSTYFPNHPNNSASLFASQSAPLSIQRASMPRSCEGRKQGNKKIGVLASHFHLTPDMKTEVFKLYNRALSNKNIILWRLKKKAILVGCCVYTVMRQHDWPIYINHICHELSCTRSEFSQVYYKVVKLLQLPIISPPITDLVDKFIGECKYLDNTEKALLTARVQRILKIAKECWIAEGRSRRPVLLSSIYIAWQSLNLKNSKITLSAFCERMGFVAPPSALNQRKNELVQILCRLANKIPWFEPDQVTPSNLCKYLEDILKYCEALVYDSNSECSGMNRRTESSETREEPAEINLDINDEEIDSYIRSPGEVQFIREMRKKMASGDNSSKSRKVIVTP